ncbi:MAG: diguanylate cyclase [Planctomycetota bacterium]
MGDGPPEQDGGQALGRAWAGEPIGPAKVLIVDDDPIHLRLLEAMLARAGHHVLKALNGHEALRILEASNDLQLVIADWMMPEMDGIDLCREIRKRSTERYIHFIMLTSRSQHDDVVEGLDAGADDYIIKPAHHLELQARVRAAQRIIGLQNKLVAAQERLREQATHDALTGIWNRRGIFDALGRELERAQRQDTALAVLMTDLDYFKRVNDSYGHLVGDEVLKEAARRICEALRPYDSVGRYGGEEFLVVAPACEDPQAMDMAERIRGMFAGHPLQTSVAAIPLTLSLGVVALRKGQKAKLDKLLSAADEALYKAKDGGRNCAVLGTVHPDDLG